MTVSWISRVTFCSVNASRLGSVNASALSDNEMHLVSNFDSMIHEEAEGDESSKVEEPKKRKKLEGQELIAENLKELSEVIAYMDYSFERAFTMQEKECMLAYKVSLNYSSHTIYLIATRCQNSKRHQQLKSFKRPGRIRKEERGKNIGVPVAAESDS